MIISFNPLHAERHNMDFKVGTVCLFQMYPYPGLELPGYSPAATAAYLQGYNPSATAAAAAAALAARYDNNVPFSVKI